MRWLLGDIPEQPRHPDSGPLVVWVCFAAAIGMWLGLRHAPKGDPVLVGTWRMLVHGGVPLVAVALWELRAGARERAAARERATPASITPASITPASITPAPLAHVFGTVQVCVGVLGLLAPLFARFTAGGLAAITADPFGAFAAPLLCAAVLTLLGLHRLGRDLGDWGIGLGDWRWWLPHHGVLLAALVPVLMLVTWSAPTLAAYYPVNKAARETIEAFGWAHFGLALDFIGWEFLFRGFLLFAVARRGDALLAIFLHAFPFFLLHANKPEIELLSSFVGGLIAAWFCLRARTFFPLFVIHVTMITVVGFTSFLMRHAG